MIFLSAILHTNNDNSDRFNMENVTWLYESTIVSEFAGQTIYFHYFTESLTFLLRNLDCAAHTTLCLFKQKIQTRCPLYYFNIVGNQ